ncbi:laminin subunit gamma-1 [Corythoichthys intestinalis]|uniref:laminin subunit gamma-1 n=1 Tax=Corythoichthys intestinalis TaxID=161448 RepID=UPI0025A53E60|nr:laminin subunit gamma-1 [Corythoichthys intestinalis]XP_061795382.1 laminin subunit gamma-1-like [Nerophis lumbriciformis]
MAAAAATAPRWSPLVVALTAALLVGVGAAMDECSDEQGRAQRCMPEFVNAAFNVTVVATDTCGSPPEEYCVQTGATGVTKSCHICDARDPRNQHGAAFLTDYNNQLDTTWWQSQTMLAGVQYPNSINLTLHLGKAFDITYVRLKFHTSRPESFAIYKRSSQDGPWTPYTYYSGSCEKTYGKTNRGFIRTGEDERRALCTDDFSDISPLTGGNVAFSTLEGRPSAYNFDNSPVLQDWVTATDIRVTLNRLNTFGDEVFNDPKVLKSYYYAISDFAVGGRCKCNGHASECVKDAGGRLVCNCKHNTEGADCQLCKAFYNDRPWRRATADSANECMPCECSGKSSECYFDAELYRATGRGGHCKNCADNTDGPKCERCLDHHYRRGGNDDRCLPCACNSVGSESPQCDNRGVCACKPGVTGEKCDRCQPGFHSLTEAGCRPCSCSAAGSTQECDVNTGQCRCKENVEGFTCDRCKPGFFNMDPDSAEGCSPCFCFLHSSVCESASGFSVHTVSSTFERDDERWTGQQRDSSSVPVNWSPSGQDISLISEDYFPMYFVAPDKFLGDQLLSFGQNLSLSFRVERRDTRLSAEDLVLEGAGLRVAVPLIAQGNAYPSEHKAHYVFRLHNSADYPWRPAVSHSDFQKLLHNLTAIKIRGTYSEKSAGHLDDVTLVTARQGPGTPARWVEHCTCPLGYEGRRCERCATGYRRARPLLGAFSDCEACHCNGHSDACNPDTGACDCQHNTGGLSCERCRDGFYGDATKGTSLDCQPCPCPAGATCAAIPKTDQVVCTNCPTGTTGKRCELCDDGFFGDPLGQGGPVRACRACKCSDNIDPNAVGNCDRETGQCLKCIYNTDGFFCDRCKDGFYGNPLAAEPTDKCNACACSPHGTLGGQTGCSTVTGQCPCLPNVVGRDCGACQPGFFNLHSGNGCERCNCDAIGSTNGQCDMVSGQCECQPGVTGARCERCEVNFFGFGSSGCKPCDCDPEGAQSGQCQEDGRCLCRPGFVGARCDMCEENYFYNRSAPGCQQCPSCYSLVRDKVNQQRQKIHELQTLIDNLASGQETVSDQAFEDRLKEAERAVLDLLDEARASKDADQGLVDRLNIINGSLTTQWKRLLNVRGSVEETGARADRARDRVRQAEHLIHRARLELDKAKDAVAQVDIKAPSGEGDPNNMTLLAEEARKLADKHKTDADQIEKIAKDANDTSTKAYNLLLKTLDGESQTARQIDELNRKYKEALELAKSLEKQANKVQAEAEEAGNHALKIFANLTDLPPFDTHTLEEEAAKIKNEALELDRLIDKAEKEYNELRDDLRPKEEEVRKLLEKGRSEQQTADQLLARADAAKATAEEAAKRAQSTFREAEGILDDLRDFDRRVNDNKTAAEEALKRIPAIQATVAAAAAKTRQAEAALGNADADAREAKIKAEEAERIAANVQKGSAKTREDAEKALQDANKLDGEVNGLMDQLSAAEEQLSKKKAEADQDMMMATMASNNAKDAEDNARKAKSAVKTVLNSIALLLEQLGNIDKVDVSKLTQIDESLRRAKDKMADSDLDRKLKELNEVAQTQEAMIGDYERQIREIRADIANLNDIKNTLPDGCFNTPSLEKA